MTSSTCLWIWWHAHKHDHLWTDGLKYAMICLGAKAVYKIDKKILSKIFGIFLLIVSIRSFVEYFDIT